MEFLVSVKWGMGRGIKYVCRVLYREVVRMIFAYFLKAKQTVSKMNKQGRVKILCLKNKGLHDTSTLTLHNYLTALFCKIKTLLNNSKEQLPQKEMPYRKCESISAKYAFLAALKFNFKEIALTA